MQYFKSHLDIFALIGSIIISTILRVVIPFNLVFQNGRVLFNAVDAYFQLRYADLITAHFPQVCFIDPYIIGYAAHLGNTPLFNFLLASLGKLLGNLEIVAAYLPAVLGILTLIPVYFIARAIFNNKWIISLSVFFIAIVSGLFFSRTQLGAADYHCLEIFLSSMMMMWVVLAVKAAKIKWTVIYAILAFVFYGLYFITWSGNIIFIGIIGVFLYVWVAINFYGKYSPKLNAIFHSIVVTVTSLVIALSFMKLLGYFGYIIRTGVKFFVWFLSPMSSSEEWALFFAGASSSGRMIFSPDAMWENFGFLFIFALVGLGLLVARVAKTKQPIEILLLVWSVVMLLLTLALRRWAYYFAINLAVLSAYACYVIGKYFIVVKGKPNKFVAVIVGITATLLIAFPLIRTDIGVAQNPQNYMSKGWQEATQYLHDELTPSEEEEYYRIYKVGENPEVPRVLTWWDYGYWIERESHMPVLANPGGGDRKLVARLFINNDCDDVVAQLKALDVKYIVVDSQMCIEKFYSVVAYAREDLAQYYSSASCKDAIQRRDAYYMAFLNRLYCGDGLSIGGVEKVFESSTTSEFRELTNPTKMEFVNYVLPEVKIFEVK